MSQQDDNDGNQQQAAQRAGSYIGVGLAIGAGVGTGMGFAMGDLVLDRSVEVEYAITSLTICNALHPKQFLHSRKVCRSTNQTFASKNFPTQAGKVEHVLNRS